MSRVRDLRRILWSLAFANAGCGRYGFDEPRSSNAVAELAPTLALATECGVVPGSVRIAIVNTGTDELVIEDASTTGGFTIVTDLPVEIAPGEQAELEIAPPAAVIGTDRGGDVKRGELTLFTNEAAVSSRTVELSATVAGANLEFRQSANQPLTLTFVNTMGVCPPDKAMVIFNTGTLPVMVTATSDLGLAYTFFAGVVDAGDGVSGTIRPTTNGPCSTAGFLTYEITGSTCTATPVVLSSTLEITGPATCSCS